MWVCEIRRSFREVDNMCGSNPISDAVSSVGNTLSDFDPTTKDGLINAATGGLYGLGGDEALQGLDDAISGQDQKDAAKAAARAQQSAAENRLDLDTRIYDEGQTKLDPFYEVNSSEYKTYAFM